jgi:hypothetical protein
MRVDGRLGEVAAEIRQRDMEGLEQTLPCPMSRGTMQTDNNGGVQGTQTREDR